MLQNDSQSTMSTMNLNAKKFMAMREAVYSERRERIIK